MSYDWCLHQTLRDLPLVLLLLPPLQQAAASASSRVTLWLFSSVCLHTLPSLSSAVSRRLIEIPFTQLSAESCSQRKSWGNCESSAIEKSEPVSRTTSSSVSFLFFPIAHCVGAAANCIPEFRITSNNWNYHFFQWIKQRQQSQAPLHPRHPHKPVVSTWSPAGSRGERIPSTSTAITTSFPPVRVISSTPTWESRHPNPNPSSVTASSLIHLLSHRSTRSGEPAS